MLPGTAHALTRERLLLVSRPGEAVAEAEPPFSISAAERPMLRIVCCIDAELSM